MGRKSICKICGLAITEEEKIKVSLGTVHIECYKTRLLEKYDLDIVNIKLDHFIEKARLDREEKLKKEKEKNAIKLKNQKDKIKENEDKDKFYKWVIDKYNISLPKQFYVKMANINNGTYKGLKEGISYEDLLYMFKTKKKELDRIAEDKKKKGNGFDNNYSRLCFDIAVIINKYDSYKAWKEKQKLNSIKTEDIIKSQENRIDISNISKQIKNNSNDDNDNIDNILDEVF